MAFRFLCYAAALLGTLPCLLHGQDEALEEADPAPDVYHDPSASRFARPTSLPANLTPPPLPPDLVPPPLPPDLKPPPAPPGMRAPALPQPARAAGSANAGGRPRFGAGDPGSGNGDEDELPAGTPARQTPDFSTATAVPISVSANDPRMQETVGIIRIPELGTNEVLEMLENFTGKPVLRQQSLPAVKITFFSQSAMTRQEAIVAIESLLSLNGIAITTVGSKFLKAVPSATINTQVPPILEGSTLGMTPSQSIYSRFFTLSFLTPTEALPLLQPLMSQGTPLLYERSGILFITDALANLQRIETVLSRLDAPAPLRVEMLFYTLEHINAIDVLNRLLALQAGSLKNQLENNTNIEADERTNQLLVFTHPSNKALLDDLIARLDVDVAPLTTTEVFHVKHAEAVTVAGLIEEVISGQKQARQAQATTQPAAPATTAAARRVARTASQRPGGASGFDSKSLQFSENLTIVPDERANTIIASGTANDLRYLVELIDKIDILLAQVRIEVIITEVRLSDGVRYGLEEFRVGYNRTGFGAGAEAGSRGNTLILPTLAGATFGTPLLFGPGEFSFDMLMQQTKTNSNIQVLSAPTIVTTHNREASINVGERRPFVTSARDTTSVTTVDNFVRNYTYQDVGIELKVKPLIGSNGVIQLEIDQQVNAVAPADANNRENPVITKRQANSFVSVGDGQMVVLGGLQSVDRSDGRNRFFILGDIPILGNLFRSRNKEEVRNELLIFIRPTIVKDTFAADRDANERLDIIESRDRVRGYLDTGKFPDAVDPATPMPESDRSPGSRRGGRFQ